MVLFKLIVTLPAIFTDVPAGLFVNAFHRWIQEQSVADHLPIDVADYAHVAGGPGTILVCSQANVHIDFVGLTYVRKRPFADVATVEESIARSAGAATELAVKLKTDPAVAGHFRLHPGELRIRFNDRLLTPNTAEAAAGVTPAVTNAVQSLYPGRTVSVARFEGSPLELLELRATIEKSS